MKASTKNALIAGGMAVLGIATVAAVGYALTDGYSEVPSLNMSSFTKVQGPAPRSVHSASASGGTGYSTSAGSPRSRRQCRKECKTQCGGGLRNRKCRRSCRKSCLAAGGVDEGGED